MYDTDEAKVKENICRTKYDTVKIWFMKTNY